jgi:hypothetical protein
VPAAPQCRAFCGDQATPNTVLADIRVPERQRQALSAYQAGGADGDRGGGLLAGLAYLHAEREPLVGIKVAASTTGVPDDRPPQRTIRIWDGNWRVRWPTGSADHSGRCAPGIRRCRGARNSHQLLPFQNLRYCQPGRQRSCHASLASPQPPVLLPGRTDVRDCCPGRYRPGKDIRSTYFGRQVAPVRQNAAPNGPVTGAGEHNDAVTDRADRPAQDPKPGDLLAQDRRTEVLPHSRRVPAWQQQAIEVADVQLGPARRRGELRDVSPAPRTPRGSL